MRQLKLNQFKGFTLAEVLITLGIIGIVAEITIPTLMHDLKQQELKAAFKKAYSVASQAWMQVVAENPGTYIARGGWGCTWPTGETQDYNASDGRSTAFKAKMDVVKSCTNYSGCWADSFEYVYDITPCSSTGSSWMTKDGMCWAMASCDDTHIMLDTNCAKKPNKIGQDIFSFLLGSDGVVYFWIDDTSSTGKPVSRGGVCPEYSDPATINGRSVSFKSWLYS